MMGEDSESDPLDAQLDYSWAAARPGVHGIGMSMLRATETAGAQRDDTGKPEPLPMYADADDAAGFLESQRGSEFFPEGSKSDIDEAPDQRRALKDAFEERPDLFQNCMLIRDFAEPLRLGSAIADDVTLGPVPGSAPIDYEPVNKTKDAPPLPDEVLITKGGIFDRGAGEHDEAEPRINMYAFLRSIAGEVAVIPNGAISRWSSKKKVPIAGYLCVENGMRVLYTLPTPCLATNLDDDGMPRPPPPGKFAAPAPAAAEQLAPAPAPAPAPSVPSGLGSFLSKGNSKQLRSEQNQSLSKQGSFLDPEKVEPATSEDFVVFVGSKKLFFSNKGKAETFCMGLAESIADDMGDHEFDVESLSPTSLKRDPHAGDFLQLARTKANIEWTTGTKKLLVLVMDWKYNDNSRRPYSRQTKTVSHYRDHIFPQVKSAFLHMSYGKFDINPTFVPEVIRFSNYRSRYATQGYPFPGLYIGAEESLRVSQYGSMYRFDDYDLVYVIAPQQSPTGTRGVAWVGAKGAICNGCEEISDSFQVMVAVHELGHNLGLAHASSKSLEYGNPFDWMGNYPDVVGLSYGAGYKLRLGWLTPQSVAKIEPGEFAGLNDRFVLKPFDADHEAASGDLVAIQLQLAGSNDLYISYRQTAGAEKGVYVVLQDKGKPDSELVDMACHTSSQKDARLRPGWTYIDPTSQVVIYLEDVTDDAATLHLFAVQSSQIDSIRGLANFTDGMYKCPRTCTDSDLLVSQYQGCSVLAGQGYCNGGSITTGGRKMDIGTDVCPVSCGHCDAVLAGPPEVGSSAPAGTGCSDRNILIGGKDCMEARYAGYCDRSTNLGHVGRDLCPKSCGYCPEPPAPSPPSDSGFEFPTPQRTRGSASFVAATTTTEVPAAATTQAATQSTACKDDATWTDSDGHGCRVYAEFIAAGRLTQNQACNYGDGSALLHCKKTCEQCSSDLENRAAATTPATTAEESTTAAPTTTTKEAPPCEDADCIESWYQSFGQCFKCSEYADTYCGKDALFMQSCPKSCKLCSGSPPPPCNDDFKTASCEEWSDLGFCDQPKIGRSCKKTCGLCPGSPKAAALSNEDAGYLSSALPSIFGPTERRVVDEHWEWGSSPALKEAVQQKEKRVERIEEAKLESGAWQFGLRWQLFAILIVCSLL